MGPYVQMWRAGVRVRTHVQRCTSGGTARSVVVTFLVFRSAEKTKTAAAGSRQHN